MEVRVPEQRDVTPLMANENKLGMTEWGETILV
jgi:hypothetical protein